MHQHLLFAAAAHCAHENTAWWLRECDQSCYAHVMRQDEVVEWCFYGLLHCGRLRWCFSVLQTHQNVGNVKLSTDTEEKDVSTNPRGARGRSVSEIWILEKRIFQILKEVHPRGETVPGGKNVLFSSSEHPRLRTVDVSCDAVLSWAAISHYQEQVPPSACGRTCLTLPG